MVSSRSPCCCWWHWGKLPAKICDSKYGTRSEKAARALHQGIRLVQGKQPREALPHLAKAVQADPQLQLAYYWQPLAHGDLGELDEAFAKCEQLVKIAEKTRVVNITIDACLNVGLTYAKIQETDKALLWLTRAVMLDPQDQYSRHWKAYRNTAVALHKQNQNLSAALSALAAYQANDRHVKLKMVVDFLDKVAETDEYGQVLYFDEQAPTIKPRLSQTTLQAQELAEPLEGTIAHLVPAPQANSLIVLLKDSPDLVIVECQDHHRLRKLKAPSTIRAVTIASGRLFVALSDPSQIAELDFRSGQIKQRWPISKIATTLAVLPAQQVAFFPSGGNLHKLHLENGQLTETPYASHNVASDPSQTFFYSFFVDRPQQPNTGDVMINGRPIFFQRRDLNWHQTALFQFAVAQKEPLLAAVRLKAASNGIALRVSPDGQFVGIIGGGGWRPSPGKPHGYGLAVFPTADLGKVQGFFPIGAYPRGAAVNAVTDQIFVLNSKQASIAHLSGQGETVTVDVSATGPAAWSPDGRFFYLATKEGLRVWENALTEAEQQVGNSWLQDLSVPVPAKKAATQAVAALAYLQKVEVKNTREAVFQTLKLAVKNRQGDRPMEWLSHKPYQQSPQLTSLFESVVGRLDSDNVGIRLYQLRKAKKKHPNHPG